MRTTFFALPLIAALSVPAVALADLYVNPKDGLKTYEVAYGCHHWGSSVRCDHASGNYANFLGSDHATGCQIHANEEGSVFKTRWHASAEPYHLYYPHKKEIKCWVQWVNDNTIEVHAK